MKFLSYFFCFFVFIEASYCQQLSFPYREINERKVVKIAAKEDFTDYVDITSYLPKNFVKNGTVDYTDFLQKAIDENRKVKFPNFPVLVRSIGLDVPSDTRILFQQKSILKMISTEQANYQLFSIINKTNVKLYNINLLGDRFRHLSNKGEWGMGLNISGSSNIKVYNPAISECWGDGIYLGWKNRGNSNIEISGGIINNNRRNAISVISANGLIIKNIMLANSNGVIPMSGLHFEPNDPKEDLKNIDVENIITFNNRKGIGISNMHLIGINNKTVSISINNVTDYFSNLVPIHLGGHNAKYKSDIKKLNGQISIKNVKAYNANSDMLIRVDKFTDYLPNISFENLDAIDNNVRNLQKVNKTKSQVRRNNILIK